MHFPLGCTLDPRQQQDSAARRVGSGTAGVGGGARGAALRIRPVASFTAGWGRCLALSHLWSGCAGCLCVLLLDPEPRLSLA